MHLVVAVEDPRAEDVRALLERHLAFAVATTPPQDVFALDVDALVHPDITFFGAREEGALLAVGALRRLDVDHAELKSMHTAAEARGRGIGRALVDRLLGFAAAEGYRRVSLETGNNEAFAPARALYARAGFQPCEPFGEYRFSGTSTCMTISLEGWAPATPCSPGERPQ